MIQTNRRTNVFEVTYIPTDHSEPEMVRLDEEQFEITKDTVWGPHSADAVVDEILDEYWTKGEPLSVIYIGLSGTPINLWGNRRYG